MGYVVALNIVSTLIVLLTMRHNIQNRVQLFFWAFVGLFFGFPAIVLLGFMAAFYLIDERRFYA